MIVEETNIKDVLILKPKVFEDERGLFFESFNHNKINKIIPKSFVQDNHSISKKGVLRGLHFQYPPFAQGKLVRVVRGTAVDVVVDIRKNSHTYGKHIKVELSDKNHVQLWVPEGMAHGFISMEENTVFLYKCSAYYSPKHEDCIIWNDEDLNIDWGTGNPIVSAKDAQGKNFKDIVFDKTI